MPSLGGRRCVHSSPKGVRARTGAKEGAESEGVATARGGGKRKQGEGGDSKGRGKYSDERFSEKLMRNQ